MAPLSIALSDSFLEPYQNAQPHWGFDGLGYIVYLRTYARKKPDGTLESWWETVKRITEGNFKIEAKRLAELNKLTDERTIQLRAEMERFYHLVYNLVMTPPGRGLWMSGTQYAEKVGDAENNCWGVSMRPQEYMLSSGKKKVSFAPVFTFDQAMKGGGVGVNIQKKYVSQIPKVLQAVKLVFVCKDTHKDIGELVKIGVEPISSDNVAPEGQDMLVAMGKRKYRSLSTADARQGWASSLGAVIDSHYDEPVDKIVVDISHVRPFGAPIVGFGGVASGPKPLVEMLKRVNDIINTRVHDFVSSTEWGDVIQCIGCCVVAGNVRRTALILIGDKDDQEYVESKNYSLQQNLAASQWRWASNNSVDIDGNADRESLRNLAVNIYYNGEPGYVNLDLSRNFGRIIDGFQQDIDGEVEVFNPCGEVTLPNGSPCNLFEINLPRIHDLIVKGIEKDSLYDEATYLGTRYAYRVTLRHYEWEVTREIVRRHRRLGVGITGVTDWILLKFGEKAVLGFNKNGDAIYNKRVTKELDRLYKLIREANKEQAAELEFNESIKVTTVKPSGTVSLLMGVSPGQHFHWSRFMIRRVRISAHSDLVAVLIQCGYHVEPVVRGYDEVGQVVYDYNTVVVEFPVKAPTADHKLFQSAKDVSLKEQAALQAMLAIYYSDNAVSATLSFHKAQPKPVYFADGSVLLDKFGNPRLETNAAEERAVVDEITDILDRYKNVIKSTSLLPHSVGTYAQMPYEEITEDRYNEMLAKIKAKPWELLNGTVRGDDDFVDSSQECVGGSCPIR